MKYLKRYKPFKTLIAIAIADVLANFIVIASISIAFDWEYVLHDPLSNLHSIGGQLIALSIIGAIVWLIAGVPVHLVKMANKLPGLWSYVWPAATIGALLGALYIPLFPITASAGLLIGAFNAIIFWLIRRPDKDAVQIEQPAKHDSA